MFGIFVPGEQTERVRVIPNNAADAVFTRAHAPTLGMVLRVTPHTTTGGFTCEC